MAFLLARFDVGDYDVWKERFDSDPAGRKQAAKGHQIFRSTENPADVFIGVEFASVDEAKSFKEKLMASGVLDKVTVKTEPTVTEEADSAEY